MSSQIFSRIFRPLSRTICYGVRGKNIYILSGKRNVLPNQANLVQNVRSKSSTGVFASDNALMVTGLSLFGGVLFYAFYFERLGKIPKLKKQSLANKQETVLADIEDEEQIEEDILVGTHPADEEIPEHVPFVLIGAGTASFAAYRAIKNEKSDAKVLIIGEEKYTPYMRPPLSKELWYSEDPQAIKTLRYKNWSGKERSLFYENDEYYCQPSELMKKEGGAVALLRRTKVIEINPRNHKIKIQNGKEIGYDKLLLATGGTAKNLKVFEDADPNVKRRTTLYRSIANLQALDKVTNKAKSIAVIGGGFLGSELACALGHRGRKSGIEIIQIFPEEGNMARVLPGYLSKWTTENVVKEGVNVMTGCHVENVKYENKKVALFLNSGEKLEVDHVVVAVGLEANVDLSKSARLEVDPELGGFRVNSELEARSDIWVAGDSACFYDVNLGRRRVEHHDHAVVSGKLAGKNMTGAKQSYWHQSMFWSDLGPRIGYEAIGLVDSSLPTIGVFAKATSRDTPKAAVEATGENIRSSTQEQVFESKEEIVEIAEGIESNEISDVENNEEYGKGVVFYMQKKRVVGIVLWNIFERMNIARKIIMSEKDQDDLNELAKHFNIHT
ncbi:apoptosis-inducing factor 1, mitochondrial-like [Dendronephthya gigantea]|uniref:apoptosis-inducing factor 1, mitochondrial-like n=1 Tax=Dendronephthya gigantea TaxID=151771 RepID=UPI00106B3645|nr:apoptosis-inducing factor 1, mitochondrial-like [Dendronephthya gigantea]